jgi:metal-responsive CopG/Arc/MetJ family transcriptional regulator
LAVIPIKLEPEDIRKLDMLVRLGVFKNRSEAIRWALREGLEKKIGVIPLLDLSGISQVVKLMLQQASNGVKVIRITSKRTAAEIVSEGRQRL